MTSSFPIRAKLQPSHLAQSTPLHPPTDPDLRFQTNQIVCLEDTTTQIFGGVVDVVESRQLLWVRPLILVNAGELSLSSPGPNLGPNSTPSPAQIADLRADSHLLLPQRLFRSAWDIEILPLLSILATEPPEVSPPDAARAMRRLLQAVCQG